jgi:hypothetical protein
MASQPPREPQSTEKARMYTGTEGASHIASEAEAIRANVIRAVFRGVSRSVRYPKRGRPPPLKMAKNPTRAVARPVPIRTSSVPTGFEMDTAISPAKHPIK